MKKGKIILSAVAFIVTASSVLAFKAHSKIAGHKVLFGLTATNAALCTLSTCVTLGNVVGNKGICHTSSGSGVEVGQGVNNTLWTAKTLGNHCIHPTTKWTIAK